MKERDIDIFFVILFPLIAFAATLLFNLSFLLSTLLFYGLLCVYLSVRKPMIVKKVLLFSSLLSVPMWLLIGYFVMTDKSWFFPFTYFPFRVFGLLTVEELIWGFFIIYSAVIFYEYFFNKSNEALMEKRMWYMLGFVAVLMIIFWIVYLLWRPVLAYSYFWTGSFLVFLPLVIFLLLYPGFFSRFVKAGLYFFFIACLHEWSGLRLEQWIFNGEHFVFLLNFFGYMVPYEEVFFWFMLLAMSTLAYYEFFNDDRK